MGVLRRLRHHLDPRYGFIEVAPGAFAWSRRTCCFEILDPLETSHERGERVHLEGGAAFHLEGGEWVRIES